MYARLPHACVYMHIYAEISPPAVRKVILCVNMLMIARNTRVVSGLRVQKYNSYSSEKKKESCGQLSFLRNYLIQNKLSPLLQELNFQDSFRKYNT